MEWGHSCFRIDTDSLTLSCVGVGNVINLYCNNTVNTYNNTVCDVIISNVAVTITPLVIYHLDNHPEIDCTVLCVWTICGQCGRQSMDCVLCMYVWEYIAV